MRLAFISTILRYPWGGADTLWTHAAEAAGERGDQLFISVSSAVAEHPRIDALRRASASLLIRSAAAEPSRLVTRVLRKLRLAGGPDQNLINALDSFRPDLVIFSQGGTYDLLLHRPLTAWLRQRGIRYRLIANWQEERPQLDADSLAFVREAFADADALAFVSTRNLATTRRHLELPLPNASVIQNPLRWRPEDVTPWPAGPTAQLATVSRLEESKGIQLLLQALSDSSPDLPAWRLNIHGRGPHEASLREVTARLGLADRVTFLGHVRELRSIWAGNQLMISPALEDGVPMTIPEAMLCQRPVLATCVGGAEDWLSDRLTGFLCPVPEVSRLATTLREALAAREQWENMGRAAAEAARQRYAPGDYLKLIRP